MLWLLLSACFQYTELSIEQMDSLDREEQIKLIKQYKKQSAKSKYTLQQKEQMLKATLQMSSNVYGPKAPETIILISTLGIFYGQEARNFDAAEDHLLRANQLWLEVEGAESTRYIHSAENLVYFYEDFETTERAIEFYEIAFEYHKSEYGIDDVDAKYFGVGLLTEYQLQLVEMDESGSAEYRQFLEERSYELFELLLALKHPKSEQYHLDFLYPEFLYSMKDYDAVEAYILSRMPKGKDETHWLFSSMFCNLEATRVGYREGISCYNRLIDDAGSYQKIDVYTYIVQTKMDMSRLLLDNYQYTESIELLKEVYTVVLQEEGIDSFNALFYGNVYASTLTSMNYFDEAKLIFNQLMELENNPNTQLTPKNFVITKNNLATWYAENGDFVLAEELLKSNIAVDDGDVQLANLAYLYLEMGEYDASLQIFEQLTKDLTIERTDDESKYDYAEKLRLFDYLSRVYKFKGEYVKSLELKEQIYDRRLLVFGERHRDTLSSLYSLYIGYADVGDSQSRQEALDEVLRLYPIVMDESDSDYVTFVLLEYDKLKRQAKYDEAIALLQDYRSTLTDLTSDHPSIIDIRSYVADVYLQKKEYDTALLELDSIREDIEKRYGTNNLMYSRGIFELANANYSLGNEVKALEFYEQSLLIEKAIVGEEHHSLIYTYQQLSKTTARLRDFDKTLTYISELFRIEQALLYNNLRDREEDKRNFLAQFTTTTAGIVSHAIDSEDSDVIQFAFKVLVSRHNLVQDLQMTDQKILRLRKSNSVVNNAYKELQSALVFEKQLQEQAGDLIKGRELTEVKQRIQHAEQVLYDAVDIERPKMEVDLEDLQQSLKKGDILLEYSWVWNPDGELSLIGFTFDAAGNISLKSLGAHKSMRRQIQAFRQTQSPLLGKSLFQKIVQPLLANTDNVEQIYIAPDGDLSTIPFELMLVEDGDMFIDHATINYLSSGRDLLRKSSPSPQNLNAVVFANPTYAEQDALTPLPHTQNEAKMLSELFPSSVVYSGVEATVDRLYNVSKPHVLHIATHGFFEPDNPSIGYDDNPMTRSGLFLGKGSDMGTRILASEIVTLDLEGTDLVVLSACESGLADTSSGDGAYGMRHAFSLAGAQNQVLSLWPVDDDATAHFMEAFYGKLANGMDKSTAMRDTKIAMRDGEQWSSPRQWGAFILIGK